MFHVSSIVFSHLLKPFFTQIYETITHTVCDHCRHLHRQLYIISQTGYQGFPARFHHPTVRKLKSPVRNSLICLTVLNPKFSKEVPSDEAREHYKRIADKYRAASIAKRKAQTQERPAPPPPAKPAASVRAPRTAEQEVALQAEVLKCVSPGTYRAHKQGLAARDGMVAQFAARRDDVSGQKRYRQ